MRLKKDGRRRLKKHPLEIEWNRFLWDRSSRNLLAIRDLGNDFVSLTVPAPCTARDVVEKIAREARNPIPIQSLSADLNLTKMVRGRVCFDDLGILFNQIATHYPTMYWWVSERGLNFENVPADLSSFDGLAGKLMMAKSEDRRLSKTSLWRLRKNSTPAIFR